MRILGPHLRFSIEETPDLRGMLGPYADNLVDRLPPDQNVVLQRARSILAPLTVMVQSGKSDPGLRYMLALAVNPDTREADEIGPWEQGYVDLVNEHDVIADGIRWAAGHLRPTHSMHRMLSRGVNTPHNPKGELDPGLSQELTRLSQLAGQWCAQLAVRN